MKFRNMASIIGITTSLGLSQGVQAADWNVSVSNLTHGTWFAGLLVSAHDDLTHVFQTGSAASANLETMAECGALTGLTTDLGGADADTIEDPNGGPLAPGASTTAMITTTATRLSIVGMLLPTNDGFVGLDALTVPTAAGTYTYYLNGYDAGTEANDETLPGGACNTTTAGIPADPTGAGGTGGSGVATTDSNTLIHVHRGVLGDTNATGGNSDLDSTVHRWQNPVAMVTITVTP